MQNQDSNGKNDRIYDDLWKFSYDALDVGIIKAFPFFMDKHPLLNEKQSIVRVDRSCVFWIQQMFIWSILISSKMTKFHFVDIGNSLPQQWAEHSNML